MRRVADCAADHVADHMAKRMTDRVFRLIVWMSGQLPDGVCLRVIGHQGDGVASCLVRKVPLTLWRAM